MKPATLGLAALAAMLFLANPLAFADHDGAFTVYPVGSDGSTTERHTFGFDETPFIYIHLPQTGLNAVAAFWQDPDTEIYLTGNAPSFATEYWHSLDSGVDENGDPVAWNDVRKYGTWNVGTGYLYADDFSFDGKDTSFTVTPEPATSAMFVVGALALAAATSRRKNYPA
jgi:hypothetical protein